MVGAVFVVGEPLAVQVGVCVIAGNVRRTAEIAFGDPGSEEYIDLKNYEKNPDRASFGWASNNSVLANLGMDYTKVLMFKLTMNHDVALGCATSRVAVCLARRGTYRFSISDPFVHLCVAYYRYSIAASEPKKYSSDSNTRSKDL